MNTKKITIAAAIFAGASLIFLIYAAVSLAGHKQDALAAEQAWKLAAAPLGDYLKLKSELAALGGSAAPTDNQNIPVILRSLNPQAKIETMSWNQTNDGIAADYKRITLPQFGLLLDLILQKHPNLQVRNIVITADKDSPDGYDVKMNVSHARQ